MKQFVGIIVMMTNVTVEVTLVCEMKLVTDIICYCKINIVNILLYITSE